VTAKRPVATATDQQEVSMNVFSTALAAGLMLALSAGGATAKTAAELNDLEIAHVAYTADNIDIRYAHLALAISNDPAVRKFAQTMIRDHTAVNKQALALLKKLNANAQDNFLSQSLTDGSHKLVDEMSKLRGKAFDRRYAQNELAYHKAVNGLVEKSFIPNIENAEVKDLFKAGLKIFKVHEGHAEMMVKKLK
jgi:putative membrane protein